MTQKEAQELCLEMWGYLAANPVVRFKRDVPLGLWEKVEGLINNCPLCEVFGSSRINTCVHCPLMLAKLPCDDPKSPYALWLGSLEDRPDQREWAANKLVRIVREWEPEEDAQ
jgi:hypothetical protein